MPAAGTTRERIISQLDSQEEWDMVIIGGGASGLGAAVESVSRGYRTLLLEQHDFSKGTSSRSTKLVHGGVRYLAQGNIPLVMEALRERGRLRQNAPHLVRDQAFVIPCYNWWCVPFYTIGLTLYDLMAGKLGIGRSVPLSKKKTRKALPCIKLGGLKGGVRYYDCQFDDSRLAVNLGQTVLDLGGSVLNYFRVKGLLKTTGKISGVEAVDMESGETYKIRSKAVINATGVFVDQVLKMDNPLAKDVVKPSQGIHLVLDRKFMNGTEALMIPKTSDGRVLFAVPWHNRLVVGTTDVEKHVAELEPHAEQEEIEYILETARRFLDCPPAKEDVLSVFTGLRPLAAPSGEGQKTKEISRGHKILISESGLVTITGGKWTTYRKMAEDVVRTASRDLLNHDGKSITKNLKIHGYMVDIDPENPLYWYGTDREKLNLLTRDEPELGNVLSKMLSMIEAQVIWAVREEMARTVEDFLSRRSRAIQLDARESIRIAPRVAELMASELGYDQKWISNQIEIYTLLARSYLLIP
ncbi:MAG: glycerol-3-phosphate dehydrogenase/oxidase [Bacteroidota bacterium]